MLRAHSKLPDFLPLLKKSENLPQSLLKEVFYGRSFAAPGKKASLEHFAKLTSRRQPLRTRY